jgi:hypothetical protein
MVADACISKPVRIATRLCVTGQVTHSLVHRIAQIAVNSCLRIFPDSSSTKFVKPREKSKLSPETIAM